MKTNPVLLGAILLVPFFFAGCDPHRSELISQNGGADRKAPADAPVTPADSIQSNDPVAAALADLKTISYETRGTAASVEEKMDGEIAALMAKWVANGRKFPGETETQYRNTRRVLTEKMNALSMATPETWASAKDAATVAMENVRGALHAIDTSAK